MSIDMVDELHAAEDRIGVLETLLETIHGFARDHPWTGLGDAYNYEGYETLLADISMRTTDRYERPSCDEDCDDDTCGAPRHNDQEWNNSTGTWENA